jgi:hypothetical protein
MKKQPWTPYDLDPVEFVELNFDFHPEYIKQELEKAGFDLKARVPVSFFRVGALKQHVHTSFLVTMDSLLQLTGLLFTPSIFTVSTATGQTPDNLAAAQPESLFLCPETGNPLIREGDVMVNQQDGLRYAIRDGIYDFKVPLD